MNAVMNAQPKPRPQLLEKRQAKADLDKRDRIERGKCRVRSGGRCEVLLAWNYENSYGDKPITRCPRRASQNHHLIGGSGRRNKGRSILAAHRIDTCDRCHSDITGNVLVPVDGTKREWATQVRYERRR